MKAPGLQGLVFKPDKDMARGDIDERVRQDGEVCLLKWMDNNAVIMASTYTGSGPTEHVK